MKKNKLLIALGAAVLIGIVSLLAYKAQNRGASDDVIRIGAILPLTGVVSEVGVDIQKGILLAREYYEKNGLHIDVQVEDGKYLAKETIGCFNKLVSSDIDGIFVAGQVPAASIKPLVIKAKIPTMATIAGAKDIPLDNDYMFRCYFSAYKVGECMGSYASTNLIAKSVAIFKIDNEWGTDSAQGFITQYNGKILGVETFDIADTDMRAQVSKLLKMQPDGVFVTGFGPGFSTCFNRLRECGYSGKIMTDPGILEPAYQKNIKDVSDIYYVCSAFDSVRKDFSGMDFFLQYHEKYHDEPSLFSAFAYTSTIILIDQVSQKHITQYMTPVGVVKIEKDGDVDIPLLIEQFRK